MVKSKVFTSNINNRFDVSVVIPLLDEEESLVELFEKISHTMKRLRRRFEVVFVDDGSSDNSFKVIKALHMKHPSLVQAIRFRRNYGKSAALTAGFQASRGDTIVTMDADLQDDPDEIPQLLSMLEDGYDLVSGWKKKRYDAALYRWPSRLANAITRKLTGLQLHDLNCGLKVYKREVIHELRIYGELYRYIPLLVHQAGFKVGEKPVQHHPRKYGHSKYTVGKFYRGFLDLLTILFTIKYIRRPLHLFGVWGMVSFFAGALIDGWLIVERIFGDTSLSNRPLFLVGILFIIIGIQFVSIGLLGEMISRNERNEKIYSVSETLQ